MGRLFVYPGILCSSPGLFTQEFRNMIKRKSRNRLGGKPAVGVEMNMIKYLLKLKYIIVFQVFTALLSIVGIASMPYVVKLLFDYDFSKGAGVMIWIVFLYLLSIALGMLF